MPFVRISLRRGQPQAYLEALSAGIHEAMTQAFDVPAADLFHAIHQHEAHELVFNPHYMGGPRSETWVLIHITAGRPRTAALKRRLYQRLAEVLAARVGLAAEDLMVIISTTHAEDWSFSGGVSAADFFFEPAAEAAR